MAGAKPRCKSLNPSANHCSDRVKLCDAHLIVPMLPRRSYPVNVSSGKAKKIIVPASTPEVLDAFLRQVFERQ